MIAESNQTPGTWYLGQLPGRDFDLLVILVVVAAFYLLTFSGVNSIDTIYYFEHAEATGGWSQCHSHHLIFPQVVKGWYRLWQYAGWSGRAELPLKVFSALGTLGAVVVFFRLALLVLPARKHAIASTLLFSFSYLPWCFASQGEPVPWFLLFAGWILLLQARVLLGHHTQAKTLVGLALVTLVGSCFHQALILTLPITFVVVWISSGPRGAFLTTGLSGSLIAACYLVGAWLGTGGSQDGSMLAWLTRYLHEFNQDYGRVDLILSSAPIRGGVSAIISGEALKSHVFSGAGYGPLALATVAFCFWLALVLIMGWGRALGWRRGRENGPLPVLLLMVVYGIVFAAAAIWWEPANRKFWAPVIPSIWLVAAYGWSAWRFKTGLVVWLITLVGLVAVNLAGGILTKHSAPDSRQPLLVYLEQSAGPEATVVLQEDRVWQCADYYLGWSGIHVIPGPKSDDWPRRQEFLQQAGSAALAALSRGQPVYCTAVLTLPLVAVIEQEYPAGGLQFKKVMNFWDSEEPNLVQGLQKIEPKGSAWSDVVEPKN